MIRDNVGRFRKYAGMYIKRQLASRAREIDENIRPDIRDELERTFRNNLYDSYSPITERGKSVKDYNKNHTHQLASPYHHTGKLASSVYGAIEGNVVQIKVKEKTYDNGKTTGQVMKWVLEGNTETPKYDRYYFTDKNGYKRLAEYVHMPPHKVAERTMDYMINVYMKQLVERLSKK